MDKLEKQPCPTCGNKTLTLTEDVREIPYFGNAYLFSMNCSHCKYTLSDVEAETPKDPSRCTFEITEEDDMKVRIVKSSTATVKIPILKLTMEPGPSSIGFISNIEGLLDRAKQVIEQEGDISDEDEVKTTAKNLLKKIWKIKLGDIQCKIIIEDPSGNSAIISEKAKIEKLKK